MQLPQCLYKYRSLSSDENVRRAKDILVNNRLHFAPAASFNDPFEGQVKISLSASPATKLNHLRNYATQTHGLNVLQASEWASRVIKNNIELPEAHILEDLRNAFRKKANFCTLSEKNDDILLWAHYADGHKGICIELKPRTAEHINWFKDAQWVRYQSHFPAVNYYEGTATEANAIAAMLTKSDHWTYEKEWRLLRDKHGSCDLPEDVISGVVLGCAISDEHRELVHDWVRSCSPEVLLYSARIKPGEYAIEIVLDS